MKIIGIFGKIASGKSTFCNFLAKLHSIEIIDIDKINSKLLQDSKVIKAILSYFPNIKLVDNKLDKKYLRHCLIHNPKDKLFLEKLLQPLIIKDIKKTILQSTYKYMVIQSGVNWNDLNKIINEKVLLVANYEERVDRLVKRDEISKNDAELLANLQKFNKHEYDFVINNNEGMDTIQNLASNFFDS